MYKELKGKFLESRAASKLIFYEVSYLNKADSTMEEQHTLQEYTPQKY